MMINVYFKSGFLQTFIVPRNILAIEFQHLAEDIGGSIKRIEFPHFSEMQAFMYWNQK